MKLQSRFRKRSILTGSIAVLSLGSAAFAQTSGTWVLNNNGNWSLSTNWLGGDIADGATATATFNLDITADRTITLDTARTIGNLSFRDTANGNFAYILAGANILTLNDGAGKPTITVFPRSNGIISRIDTVLAGSNGFELVAGTPGTLGQLGIAGNNTFTGAVTIGPSARLRVDHINNGLGAKDALGIDPALAVHYTEVQNGGTLQINSATANNMNWGSELIKVQGAGTDGTGAIINLNAGQNNVLQQVQLTGDTTFGGTGRWDIRTGTAATGRLHQNGFTLTKTGTNQVSLVNVMVIGGGNIDINQGIFAIEAGSSVGGTGAITVNSGASLNFWSNTTATGGGVTRQIVANGGSINMGNSNGTATIPAPIELRASTIFNQSTDGGTLEQMIFTGNITESDVGFGPIKNGTGQIQFNGANTYTGPLTVNAGILILNGTNANAGQTTVNAGTLTIGATGSLGSRVIDIKSGATFNTSALAGGHTLPANVGRIFLGRTGAAANDLVGSLTLDTSATFEIGPSARNGGVAPVRTATVSGNLTFNGGGATYFDLANTTTAGGGVNDLVAVGGTLTLNGTTAITVTPIGGSLASGSYTLFTSAALIGDFSNLALGGIPSSTRQAFAFDTTTVANSVLLNVSGAAASLIWTGNGTTNEWDVSTSNHWNNAGGADVFFNLDSVTFDGTGSSTPAVKLVGSLKPGTITVSGAVNYTFGGTGTLDGGAIVKSGTGKLTITGTAHSFSGSVQVNGGTISVSAINNAGAPGGLGINSTIGLDGGTLEFTGATETNNRIFNLGANGGTVNVTNGATRLATSQLLTGTGTLTLTGPGTFLVGQDDADYTFATRIAGSGNLALNPHMVVGSTTARQVTISADNTGFTGGIILQSPASGSYRTAAITQTPLGSAHVTVQDGAQLFVAGAATITSNATITGLGYIETNGTGFGAIRIDNATYAGNINIVGSAAINAHNSIGTVTGNISGGTLLMGGTNFNNNITLVLTGTNSYGDTIVNSGGTGNATSMLQIGNGGTTGSLGTGPVTINGDNKNGILRIDRADGYGLAVGQTITGGGSALAKAFLDLDVLGTGFNNNGQTIDLGTAGGAAGNIRVGVTRASAVASLSGNIEAGNIQVGVLNAAVPTTNAVLTIASGANVSASNLSVSNGGGTAPLGNTNGGAVNVQPGTVFSITGNLFLGEQNSSAATMTQDGGNVTVGGQFRIGHWPNHTSVYNMNGGSLTLTGTPGGFPYFTNVAETGGGIYLGIDGVGVFNQTAGTVSTRWVVLDNRGDTALGTDTYHLDGGELVITNSFGIISRNASTAFSLNGGTLTAGTSFNLDSNTISVNGASAVNTNGNTITALAPIGGLAGLTVTGGGVLETADSATAGFNGGGSLGFVPVTISAGTALRSTRNSNDVWEGVIDGGGNLIKSGTGDLILQGANTYTGQTLVNDGTLTVQGSLASGGAVTITGPGALGGPGSVGSVNTVGTGGLRPGTLGSADGDVGTLTLQNLTVNSDGDLRIDIDGTGLLNDSITVVGTATFAGASTITPIFAGIPMSPSSYPILTAGTLVPTVVPTVSLAGGPTRFSFGVDTTTQPNTVLLTVSGSTLTLNWNATNNNVWDVANSVNWKDGAFDEAFYVFDDVIFPDAALDKNVVIDAGGVQPASITVGNSVGNDYTFSGGAINGATGITKGGTGTLTIANTNAYTGVTVITGGVLRIATNNKPLGDSGVVVGEGATFDVGGQTGAGATRRYELLVEGAGAPGQAAIWNSGGAVVNNPIYRSITLTNNASIGGVGRYDLNGGNVDGTGVTFNGGTFTLTKVGTNETWWAPNGGATIGSIIVEGGTFGVQSSFNLGDNTFPIIVNPAGELRSYSTVTNDKPIVLNGGYLATLFETGTWTNTVTLNGAGTSNRIGGGGVGITLDGTISGSGFEKVGANVLRLQNALNDWSGDTRVSGGTIIVDFGGNLSPNTTLDMNGGVVDVNSTTQTVAGLKGAAGTIQGNGELIIDQVADTTYTGTIAAGMTITKDGSGELTLNGTQNYSVLNIDDGTLNLNSPLLSATITNDGGDININASINGSTVNANSGDTVTFNVSATLAGLNIGPTGLVVVADLPPAPLAAIESGDLPDSVGAELVANGVPTVPEPGSVSLLLLGALGLLGRRRRAPHS